LYFAWKICGFEISIGAKNSNIFQVEYYKKRFHCQFVNC
jgi:hypothetical protein